ncbi:hypothetical protein V5G28_022505 [Scytonema sp. PRP1]
MLRIEDELGDRAKQQTQSWVSPTSKENICLVSSPKAGNVFREALPKQVLPGGGGASGGWVPSLEAGNQSKTYSRLQVYEVQVFNSKARYRAKFTSDS